MEQHEAKNLPPGWDCKYDVNTGKWYVQIVAAVFYQNVFFINLTIISQNRFMGKVHVFRWGWGDVSATKWRLCVHSSSFIWRAAIIILRFSIDIIFAT